MEEEELGIYGLGPVLCSKGEMNMKKIQELIPGLLLCLAIAVPCWFLGKAFPIVGGPVFAILIGMVIKMCIRDRFCRAMECLKTWRKRSGASVYDENTGKGLLRHLYLRRGEKTGEVMVCLVCNGERIPCEEEWVDLLRRELPGLASVLININREKTNVVLGRRCRTLWGKGTITDVLCGISFELSPLSFYQVNPLQTERLYGDCLLYTSRCV